MSYFDDASLVMIPSGYKDQKVYSVKPLDGSGDLTFSRASSATRVASNGLIEKVRTNVVTYSEAFDNAAWNKGNLSVSANSIANPIDGATTADTIVEAATTGTHYLYQSPSLTGEFTYSVYAKAKERDHIVIAGSINTTTFYSALFDLTNGLVEQQEKGSSNTLNAAIVAIGSGWYRCSVTITSATAIPFVIWTSDGSALSPTYYEPSYAGNGTSGVYVFGAQAESGVATDYIATTSAAVSVGPVSGLPRLDYLNSTCPRLLLEPQRSNLTTYSEQLNNAAWTIVSATLTANATTSPSGYQDADTISTTAANSFTGPTAVTIAADGTTYTQSIFVKYISGYENFKFRTALTGGSSIAVASVFNANTGTLVSTDSTAQVVDYGNGWYRVSHQITNNGTNTNFIFQMFPSGDAVNTNSLAFWGAQVEAGAYATSYIPTLGTSVTRVADAATKTGISSLIGQTEGTVFVEFKRVPKGVNYQAVVTLQGASPAYLIEMYFGTSNALVAAVYNNGAQYQTGTSALTEGTYKAALAYKENDFAFYVNGVQISTDNSGTVPALSTYNLGDFTYSAGFPQADGINQALLFKTRLTNAQLAELTTL